MQIDELVSLFRKQSYRALSRAISMVENKSPGFQEILSRLTARGGSGYVVGVTGPAGSGKSTLVNELARGYRQEQKKVGIVAVDPSSPFTGGAFLGDRVRMQQLAVDEDIYIRSMASRGHLGGLSAAARNVARLLDAFGFDLIIIETVGVGQAEVDIVKTADTTVLVCVPGLGDDIQASKAGLMEIGDLFVINKADHSGVERVEMELDKIIKMAYHGDSWVPPIIKTVASQGAGIEELLAEINRHNNYLVENNLFTVQRQERAEEELLELIGDQLYAQFEPRIKCFLKQEALAEQVATANLDPYTAAQKVVHVILQEYHSHDN